MEPWKEAIAKLKKLDAEGVADLVSAVEARIEALESDKFTTIGEKRTATQKAATYESALTQVAKALGIEGDLDAILSGTEGKARAIATELTQIKTEKATLETRATEAEGKIKGFERKSKIGEIAAAAGASAAVLERLLGDKLDELKVEGEGDKRIVKLGEKELKEAIAADEALKPFEAALFPQTEKSETKTQTGKLPGGNPQGAGEKKDLLAKYAERNYGGGKALIKAKTEAAGS